MVHPGHADKACVAMLAAANKEPSSLCLHVYADQSIEQDSSIEIIRDMGVNSKT